jgi:hypothetical protein
MILEHINQGTFWVLLSLIALSITTAHLGNVDLPLLSIKFMECEVNFIVYPT